MQTQEIQHTCPVWVGRLMVSPLRKLYHNPYKILSPYVKPGMNILELGPAMGYFSLPLATLTGIEGKVYCVDIQAPMLEKLKKRAEKAYLDGRIETRQCTPSSLMVGDLTGTIDFALLFAMVHEVPDQNKLFNEVSDTLKVGCKVLFSEPCGHVKPEAFNESLRIAKKYGLKVQENINIKGSRSVVLHKI